MSNDLINLPIRERQLRRIEALHNLKTRFSKVRQTPLAADRFGLWRSAIAEIGPSAPHLVLDFGVYQGRSTRFWADGFTHPDTRIHGFDSFEGLPEDWAGKMVKGTFSTGGAMPEIDDSRVAFHKGWIQNTLPPFLRSEQFDRNASLVVHIDIDLYSAALFILSTMWHFSDRYFIILDEFGVDENLALADFASAFPVEIEFFGHTFDEKTGLPQQVFGRVTRTTYTA